ncbi:MAG: ABC transporter ATP-binding protein [Caldilineaceae bacterium]
MVWRIPEKDASRRIHEALELVGLRPAETLGRFPHQLSGGQRQRIEVARASVCQPKLIIADEPVSMVDARCATILAGLQTLNRDGISILYITHDLTTAYQVCDNIMVMYSGSVVEAGNAEKVIRHQSIPASLCYRIYPFDGPVEASAEEVDETAEKWAEDQRCITSPSLGGGDLLKAAPLLYQTEPDRAAACVLAKENKVIEAQDMAQVL